MRVIFLNSWWARCKKDYWDFILKESKSADFFCLQEVTGEMFEKLQEMLSDFQGVFDIKREEYVIGQAIFVKKENKILSCKSFDIYKTDEKNIGFLQVAEIKIGENILKLGNIHGVAHPGDKLDNSKRLTQSKNILKHFKKEESAIFGGDFNLMPTTKSISMLEDAGFKNLIKKYKIKTTRSKINLKMYPKQNFQAYADYVFVSEKIKDKNLTVPDIVVSDHLPLILDF